MTATRRMGTPVEVALQGEFWYADSDGIGTDVRPSHSRKKRARALEGHCEVGVQSRHAGGYHLPPGREMKREAWGNVA